MAIQRESDGDAAGETSDGMAAYRQGQHYDEKQSSAWRSGWLAGAQSAQRDLKHHGAFLRHRNTIVTVFTEAYAVMKADEGRKQGVRERQRRRDAMIAITTLLAQLSTPLAADEPAPPP